MATRRAVRAVKQISQAIAHRAGYELVPRGAGMPDISDADRMTLAAVRRHTMTTPERIVALVRGVEYIVSAEIPGEVVECGVWRGGSMMAVARTLLQLGVSDRELYLYDTFEGMPDATDADVSIFHDVASERLAEAQRDDPLVCYAPFDVAYEGLKSTGYPMDRVHLTKGRVEETIPGEAPEHIALLRLDTDWYESTKHELVHLYPRLHERGVLIIDDYGHWQGARQAVDEYLGANNIQLLLNRIDYSGRIAIKA
jgi:O-methyltransferase